MIPSIKRSNNAHKRLAGIHSKVHTVTGDRSNWLKSRYHSEVIRKQISLDRKLSMNEKKNLFEHTDRFLITLKKSPKVDFVNKLENAAMKKFKKPYMDLTVNQRVSILDSTGTTKELLNQK